MLFVECICKCKNSQGKHFDSTVHSRLTLCQLGTWKLQMAKVITFPFMNVPSINFCQQFNNAEQRLNSNKNIFYFNIVKLVEDLLIFWVQTSPINENLLSVLPKNDSGLIPEILQIQLTVFPVMTVAKMPGQLHRCKLFTES